MLEMHERCICNFRHIKSRRRVSSYVAVYPAFESKKFKSLSCRYVLLLRRQQKYAIWLYENSAIKKRLKNYAVLRAHLDRATEIWRGKRVMARVARWTSSKINSRSHNDHKAIRARGRREFELESKRNQTRAARKKNREEKQKESMPPKSRQDK